MISAKTKLIASLLVICCGSITNLSLEASNRVSVGNGSNFIQAQSYSLSPCLPMQPAQRIAVGSGCSSYSTRQVIIARSHPSSYDRYKMHDHAQQFPSACHRRPNRCAPPVPVEDYYPCDEYEYSEYTETYIVEEPAAGCCLPSIRSIYAGGELIQLTDGSLWQIPSFDKKNISNWAVNDSIQISSTQDKQFPFRLTNRCSQSTVRAIMKAGAAVQRYPDCGCPGANDQGTVLQNIGEGDMIQLGDGTLWEIAAYEQMKSKLWREGDRIFITRSRNPIYPFQLTNLTSQENVQASLKT